MNVNGDATMNKRQLCWIIAALFHFSMVLCGATKFAFTGDSLPERILGQYGDISGANNSYSFFAPAVSSQSRVALVMRDLHGKEWEDTLVHDPSTVLGWRAAAILDGLPDFPDQLRRGITACWASVMFGRYPAAEEVTVNAEIEALPTMEEWRHGTRPTWKPVYQGTFRRKGDGVGPNHGQ